MKIRRDIKKKILSENKKLSIQQLSDKYSIDSEEIKKILNSTTKSIIPVWFYAIMVLIPVAVIVCLEITLQVVDYGYDFTTWVDAGNGKYVINPNIGRKYFTSGNFNPNTIEDVFDQKKKENSFRVFVVGGSSAEGYPFNPMGAFSRYIRKRLELVYQNTKIEVVNISMTAVNTYTILDLIPDVLEMKPDLILIYAGHNEYYGALGVGSAQSFGSIQKVNKLILYLNNFKITQLTRNILQSIVSVFTEKENSSSGTLMSRMAQDKNIEFDSEIFNLGIKQFRSNISAILEKINNANVPVIIGKLVSNLKDQKPFISINSKENKSADEVYKNAQKEYINRNYSKAKRLFEEAKDLDVLRFRAPGKINQVIDELGNEFNLPVVPFDSIFADKSEQGIVGDNLFVDHLHPNVQGYKLIGKGFYESMYSYNYLPKKDSAIVEFKMQDSLTNEKFVFTELDSVLGNYYVKLLKSDWPYTKKRVAISEFTQNDFYNLFKPISFIDSLAILRIQNKVTWIEAHLIGATYNLRKDEIKEYLKYMDVLIYQYPSLGSLDNALRYFHKEKKIKLADYTFKRTGLMALYIGNYENAIKYLNEAAKINPTDVLVLGSLTEAYFKNKEYDKALLTINKCLSIGNNYNEADILKRKIINKLKR